jgi:AcrR family transcriptional regulator
MTLAAKDAVRRKRSRRGSGEQLRAEIVTAARDLLASAPHVDAVSIRSVAEAVGVTPPSIYLHFADKDDLISAVVAAVFAELDAAMLEAASRQREPLERLRAFGTAYVQFALGHPEHYRLAAMDLRPMSEVDEALASSAFVHFRECVAECMAAGIFVGEDPTPLTLELWAVAHGIASLLIAKPFLPWGDVDRVVDEVLCAAALGHAAAGIVGRPITPAKTRKWLSAQRKSGGNFGRKGKTG